MTFLEKDLEQIIYDADKELLAEKGLCINGKLFRQLRIGNYGIADLVTHKRPYFHSYFNGLCKGEITVYELKQNKIGISTFLQALGYLKGIKHYLKNRNLEYNYNYRIVLIGNEIDLNSTFIYLNDFVNWDDNENLINSISEFHLELYKYSYEFNGINFKLINGSDYVNTNSSF